MQFCNIRHQLSQKKVVSLQAKVTNMELRVRIRYKSTSDFGKGDHLKFDKSLAHALEWLYDEDQFEDERTWLYCMEGVLPIYIMMSIVTDIFTFALQDYAETNIKDYILRMEEGNTKHGWNDNKPTLIHLGDEIVLGKVHTFTSEVILWATYLYASFRADIEEDNEKLKKAKNVLYKLFWKKTGLKEEFVKDTFLMKHFDQTTRDFVVDFSNRYKKPQTVADNTHQQPPLNRKMEESVLDKIPANNIACYYEGWRNGKKGGFVQERGIYRFHEMAHNKGGILDDVYPNQPDRNPIVAVGIVASWLMFNNKKQMVLKRLTQYKNGVPGDIKELFDNYTKENLVQFKAEHSFDPDAWERDWEYEFYTRYIIPHEMKLNKISEALFNYISDSDINLVRAVMKSYIKYLKKCRSEKGYRVSPELLVLRAVDSQDDTKYEDLEEFEVTTILDTLEEKGYIQVAWIEGHKPEAVRLLDKGRVYMKHLEEGSVAERTNPVVTPQQQAKENTEVIPPQTQNSSVREITWAERKQCFKTAVLVVMEKRKAVGDYLFENNSQWMAVYRFAIDLGIMYDVEDPRKPKDTSTPQYAVFEKFAHELQFDENPPTRLPFTKNAIDSINSKPNYARFNTSHPWSHEGISDPRSLDFFIEMDNVYLELEEEYNNLISQAERVIK